jgi:hypothetical protein
MVRHDLIAAHDLDLVDGLAVVVIELRIDGAGLSALSLFSGLDRLGQRGLRLIERVVIFVGGQDRSRQKAEGSRVAVKPSLVFISSSVRL